MDVEVRHTLANPVIDSNKSALRIQRERESTTQPLNHLKEWDKELGWKLGQSGDMNSRNDQCVARKEWTVIEKSEDSLITVDERGRQRSCCDLAEGAGGFRVGDGRSSMCHQPAVRSETDHGAG